MTYVDAHRTRSPTHGFCAGADSDPDFDKDCFSATGESFSKSLVEGAEHPLSASAACASSAPTPRARAGSAPRTTLLHRHDLPGRSLRGGAADRHPRRDLGVMSAVYGGALHPTAEGHAAIADAALAAAKEVLGAEQVKAQ